MDIDPELLEKLAEAAHNIWMEGKLSEGWKYGPVTDKEKKIHSSLLPYNKLCESDKKSDRDFVSGIHRILAIAGYKMVKK